MKRPRLIVALLVASGCLCVQPFSPSYVLDSPRILALRSTPVDLVVDAGVTLDSLVYLPPGSSPPDYTWSWCASLGGVTNGFSCSITADELQQAIDPDGSLGVTINYALGTTPSVRMSYPVSAEVLSKICGSALGGSAGDGDGGDDGGGDAGDAGAGAGDAGDAGAGGGDAGDAGAGGSTAAGALREFCQGGGSITVLLTLTVGKESYQAYRSINLLTASPTYPVDNPTIESLTVGASGVASPDGGIPSNGLALLADIAPDASGEYAGIFMGDAGYIDGGLQYVDIGVGSDAGSSAPEDAGSDLTDAGSPVSEDAGSDLTDAGDGSSDGGAGQATGSPREVLLSEGLTLSWYVERGTLTSSTTSLPVAPVGATRDWAGLLGNWWGPAGSGSAEMILVVRGSQGGVGWFTTEAVAPAESR